MIVTFLQNSELRKRVPCVYKRDSKRKIEKYRERETEREKEIERERKRERERYPKWRI